MANRKLHIGCDEDFFYEDVELASTGAAQTGGTFSVVVKTLAGVAVTGCSASGTEPSSGNYLATIDGPTGTANLTRGDEYEAFLTFVKSGANDQRVIRCVAVYRGEE